MNSAAASGFVQGPPELRITRDNRRVLNFVVAIEGEGQPYLHVGYLLRPNEEPNITAGMKIAAYGMLKHHCARGLFLAAAKIRILTEADGRPVTERRGLGSVLERRAQNGEASPVVGG